MLHFEQPIIHADESRALSNYVHLSSHCSYATTREGLERMSISTDTTAESKFFASCRMLDVQRTLVTFKLLDLWTCIADTFFVK